jgi:hypothetical protein
MNRRGCLIAVGVIAGLGLLCCVLLWFVAIPRFQDEIVDEVSLGLSTEIANQVDTAPGTLEPGTYTVSLADLERQINAQLASDDSASDFVMTTEGDQIRVGFSASGQDLVYTGRPVVENGQIVIEDMEVDNGVLNFFLPADKVARLIENGLNDYLGARGLQAESISLADGEITFTAVAAGA